jgi:hypothetical protein
VDQGKINFTHDIVSPILQVIFILPGVIVESIFGVRHSVSSLLVYGLLTALLYAAVFGFLVMWINLLEGRWRTADRLTEVRPQNSSK